LWRMLVIVGVFQIVGSIIGFFVIDNPDPFMSIWTGGAVSTLPGLFFGWIVQKSTRPETLEESKTVLRVCVLASTMLTIVGLTKLYIP